MSQKQIDHRGMDRVLGPLNNFPDLAAIVGAIFSHVKFFSLPDKTRLSTKIMAGGLCFAVDHDGIRYVEQNPRKQSPEAERARNGAKIVWVIQTHRRDTTNGKLIALEPNQWIGKIEDGIVRMR